MLGRREPGELTCHEGGALWQDHALLRPIPWGRPPPPRAATGGGGGWQGASACNRWAWVSRVTRQRGGGKWRRRRVLSIISRARPRSGTEMNRAILLACRKITPGHIEFL